MKRCTTLNKAGEVISSMFFLEKETPVRTFTWVDNIQMDGQSYDLIDNIEERFIGKVFQSYPVFDRFVVSFERFTWMDREGITYFNLGTYLSLTKAKDVLEKFVAYEYGSTNLKEKENYRFVENA